MGDESWGRDLLEKLMWITLGINGWDNQWIRILFVSGMELEWGGVDEMG